MKPLQPEISLREHSSSHLCRICHASLGSKDAVSEVYGGVVCGDCSKIERVGFFWSGIGAIFILLIWAIVIIFYHFGIVGNAAYDVVDHFVAVKWWAIWFGLCMLITHFRLNKRKRLRKSR